MLCQKLSAKALPRVALGKEPSGNFETAKGSLPRALYRAHGNAFAEGPLSGTRQSLCRGLKKPSAKKNLRQRKNQKKPEKIAK
jgi:hypothetical protein